MNTPETAWSAPAVLDTRRVPLASLAARATALNDLSRILPAAQTGERYTVAAFASSI